MNTTKLYDTLRSMCGGKLSQQQVDSVESILKSCNQHGVTDLRLVAYILATAYHEARFKPIEEIGKGKGLPYGGKLDIGGGPGKRVPYTTPDKLYYGRGLVQLTWKSNYAAFAKLLKIDLVARPELALQTEIAAQIIVIGMKKGMFTGASLSGSFNDKETNPDEARKIVNGTDKAKLISGYFWKIYDAMK